MADCLFCRIVAGEIPSDRVYDDEQVFAFRDISPQAPTHVLVVPRVHYPTPGELAAAEPDAIPALLRAATTIAAEEGVAGSGYRLVFNVGADANQTVDHVHLHVIGGRGMSWPPG